MAVIFDFLSIIYNKKRFLVISIFVVSIIFSLCFLFFLKNIGPVEHGIPGTDYLNYYEPIADNILKGEGISVRGGVPTNIGPVFPVLLSGIFALANAIGMSRLDLIVAFNVFLAALAAVFLFLLAAAIFNKRIALIASLLWASYPLNLWFLKNPNTETLFIPLLFIGLWLCVLALEKRSLRFIFLSGFVLGLASMVRIIGLFLPIFLVLPILYSLAEYHGRKAVDECQPVAKRRGIHRPAILQNISRSEIYIFAKLRRYEVLRLLRRGSLFFWRGDSNKRRFLLIAALLIGSFIAILPWGIYTFERAGSFVIPFSRLGPQAVIQGFSWLSEPGAKSVLSPDMTATVERARFESNDIDGFAKVFRFLGQELIKNPVPFLKLAGLKLARSWYATSTRWYELQMLAVQIPYLLSGLLGLIYAERKIRDKSPTFSRGIEPREKDDAATTLRQDRRVFKKVGDKIPYVFFLSGVILYFWAMTFAAVSILRYMIPAMGLVMIFSAIAINNILEKLIKFRL